MIKHTCTKYFLSGVYWTNAIVSIWLLVVTSVATWSDTVVCPNLVPRLFLVEERAWQHSGVRPVYLCCVMVM